MSKTVLSDQKLLTFAPQLELLGLRLRIDRVLLLGGLDARIDVVRGYAALIRVRISLENLDILLNVARMVVLAKVVLESGRLRLEQGLLRSKSGVDVISGARRDFFAQLAEPQRSVIGDLFLREHARLVERIV